MNRTHTSFRFVSVSVFCASLLVGATGCKKVTKELFNKVAGEASGSVLGPTAEEKALGHYADGFNELIGGPQSVVKEYFSKIPEEGPEPGKKYRLFPQHNSAQHKLEKIKTSFASAAKEAPAEMKHIEPLATGALTTVEKFMSDFREAHKYYDSDSFKDDQGKQGSELHGRLLATAKDYRENVARLESELEKIEETHNAKELAKFEGDKDYSYWFRFMQAEANHLIKSVDPSKFEAAYARFEKSRAEFAAFASSKGSSMNASFQSYVSQVDSFESNAKKLARQMKEDPQARSVDSMRNSLISNYNSMVSVTNSLRQLEANDLLK